MRGRSSRIHAVPLVYTAPSGEGRAMIDRMGSRGRAEAWRPWVPAGRRPAWAWPDAVSNLARGAGRQLREWTAAEVAPGRLVPWLAIGFGSGIVIYFALDREPALW